jgi:hypothetical protein
MRSMNSLNLQNLHLPNLPDLLPELRNLSDLSRASGSWLATLGVGIVVGLPMTGAADPIADPLEKRPPASYRRMSLDAQDRPPAWMGENVQYKKGVGLEYSREVKVGEKPVEVGVGGPILRKKKSAGLTFEVRF